TTTRSGEVIVTSKKEPGFMKKAESEELETQKPQVKLRRTVSEVVRPASTPPIIASAIKDDDDEDRIIAELEVFQRSSASPFLPTLRYDPLVAAVSPGHADMWPNGAAEGWKELAAPAAPGSGAFSLPQIVLTEWVSEPEVAVEPRCSEHGEPAGHGGAGGDGRHKGSSKASPRCPLAPCPQGMVTALLPAARSEGSSIAPQLHGDTEPRGGAGKDASLPPGHARREQCGNTAVLRAGCPPTLWGSEWGRAEHPPHVALQDRGSDRAGVGGMAAEGLRGPTAQGRSEAEGSPLHSMSPRSREICEGAFQRLDSLEETIRELEMTISEISSHRSAEDEFPQGWVVPRDAGRDSEDGEEHHELCDDGTALDLSQTKADAATSPSPSHATKPPLLPKPQLGTPQSGGVSIPPMKMVNPSSRLKQSQQGSPDKSKHIKQRMEYMRIQGQQQVAYL
ncbi:SRCN1 inhibitor, partial [Odontophorus gujanensis]|nr:SRCN1 inhibitor [Odontophorus gujanensis]